MKIRIYETDFEGNPIECTGEYFSGATALNIVNAMKLNPFQASLTPLDFMRQILKSIGQEKFPLPKDTESAALFLFSGWLFSDSQSLKLTKVNWIRNKRFSLSMAQRTSPVKKQKYLNNIVGYIRHNLLAINVINGIVCTVGRRCGCRLGNSNF